jgi:3-oxoacyl-[acyl-carrier-protein] synthase II
MSKRRVVVTGLGTLNPIGLSVEETWQNALAGKSGVRLIEDFDTSNYPSKFAGLVPKFDITSYMSAKDARKCDLFIQYGIAASVQAVLDANLKDNQEINLDRVGVIMGSGIGGLTTIEQSCKVLTESGPRKISPFFIPATIINMISGHLSIMYGFKGPNLAVSTACTTSTHCIGLGFRSIQYGDADIMIAGGAEKASTPLGMSGFAASRALSTRNGDPSKASRPWDRDRDGFVLGDGAGAVVLEEYEHAKKRGAKIYAEICGFGLSGDAFHITRPSGDGAVAAMLGSLKDARINPEEVNYINAHATSTSAGDLEESLAIKRVIGENAVKNILVSGTKSMTGHLLGAAGALEAIFTILSIRDKIAPPTINLDNVEEGCDLDYVANKAREFPINIAMSNSFGFGGTNGTILFKAV